MQYIVNGEEENDLKEKFEQYLQKMVSGLYGILMFAVLLSCLTSANVEYARKTIPLLSEWKLLIGGMISWIICIYIGDKISKKFFAKHTKSLIWICSLSFFYISGIFSKMLLFLYRLGCCDFSGSSFSGGITRQYGGV